MKDFNFFKINHIELIRKYKIIGIVLVFLTLNLYYYLENKTLDNKLESLNYKLKTYNADDTKNKKITYEEYIEFIEDYNKIEEEISDRDIDIGYIEYIINNVPSGVYIERLETSKESFIVSGYGTNKNLINTYYNKLNSKFNNKIILNKILKINDTKYSYEISKRGHNEEN